MEGGEKMSWYPFREIERELAIQRQTGETTEEVRRRIWGPENLTNIESYHKRLDDGYEYWRKPLLKVFTLKSNLVEGEKSS